MLGIDHQNGRFRSDESGTNPGVFGRKRRDSTVRRTVQERGVCVDRENSGAPAVRHSGPNRKGHRTPISSLHDGPEPGTDRPASSGGMPRTGE
jgi:hypothetical protein